jgi:hypothetical protein
MQGLQAATTVACLELQVHSLGHAVVDWVGAHCIPNVCCMQEDLDEQQPIRLLGGVKLEGGWEQEQ